MFLRRRCPLSGIVAVRRRGVLGAFFCLWCFFSLISAPASLAQYRFDLWTADDGLPQNIIRFIHQTRDGYLWFATADGLVRFDGVRFTTFNKSNSPGINSNRFLTLYEDHAGALWAGTEDGGLTRYWQGGFQTWTTQDGLASNHIGGISGDEQGTMSVLSGTQIMRWAEGRFHPSTRDFPIIRGGAVLGWGGRGAFWGVNENGLYCYVNGRTIGLSRNDGLPSLLITSVSADQRGTLWAATADAGLTKIEGGRVSRVYRANRGLPGDWVWPVVAASGPELKAFSKDARGALWLTDLDSGENRLLTERPPEALVSLHYYRLFEDREGNLWIGTEGGGLYRARPQAISVYSKDQGLADRNTYPMVEDHEGGVWIATGDLTRFMDGEVTVYTARNSALGWVYGGLYVDRAGQLWVGTAAGVQVFERGRFRFVDGLRDLTRSPFEVMAMHQDRQGALWLGTNRGRLIRYQDGVPVVYTREDGVAGDDVKVIIEDATGDIWIGAYGGLSRYKDGRFTGWTARDGLPGNSVRALYADADGALWIGTYDSGLGRYKDGRFTRYTTREGLYNDGVFQILEDARGNLWMSCNRGIYRVSKRELNEFADGKLSAITSVAYGKGDGMLNAECNGGRWPAGIKARDGRLWFPTQDGAAVVDPEKIITNRRPPPVMIESFLIDRQPTAFDQLVRIAPGLENFEIGYTALSFVNSEHVKFKYKLDGLDRDWVDAGARRTAYYSHVPPGDYTFTVIAANSDGVWNTEGRSLRVTVEPPFYRAWWFVALIALGLAAAVLAAFNFRVARLRREQERQRAFSRQLIASQEAERYRIAAELHDSLGQHLLIIKNRAALGERFAPIESKAREQFDEIDLSAGKAIGEVRAIAYNLRPLNLDRLGLTAVVEEMIVNVSRAVGIQFAADIEPLDDLFSKEDEISFYRVIQESVNNVVKHSGATKANVEIWRADGHLHAAVRDNGRGFGAAAPPGFGLNSIAERVRMLGGTHAISSTPGEGTALNIRVPILKH